MVDGFIVQYLDEELKVHFFEAYQKMIANSKIWDGNISIVNFTIPGEEIKIKLLLDDPNSDRIYKGDIALKKQWLYDAEQGEEIDKYAKIPRSTKPEDRIKLRILYTIFVLYRCLAKKEIIIEPGEHTLCLRLIDNKCSMFVYAEK